MKLKLKLISDKIFASFYNFNSQEQNRVPKKVKKDIRILSTLKWYTYGIRNHLHYFKCGLMAFTIVKNVIKFKQITLLTRTVGILNIFFNGTIAILTQKYL